MLKSIFIAQIKYTTSSSHKCEKNWKVSMTCFTKFYNFFNSPRSAKHPELFICWYPVKKHGYKDITEGEDTRNIFVKVSIDL